MEIDARLTEEEKLKGDLNMRNYDRMVKRRKFFTSVWNETERKRDDLEGLSLCFRRVN